MDLLYDDDLPEVVSEEIVDMWSTRDGHTVWLVRSAVDTDAGLQMIYQSKCSLCGWLTGGGDEDERPLVVDGIVYHVGWHDGDLQESTGEPVNHVALIDKFGGTWVRVDERPARNGGTWWPITDGPGWEASVQDHVGQGRPWDWLDDYAPFTVADPQRAARALDLVLRDDDLQDGGGEA